MRRGKTLGKRRTANGITKEEVKQEVRKEVARDFKGSAHMAAKMGERMSMASNNGVDVGYVKTLLFPELYNADVPQPLSTQSYCRFSDKKEMTFQSKGSGLLLWYPKTMVGPQLFVKSPLLPEGTPLKIGTGSGEFMCGGYMDYSTYFSQGNLVSASLQIQYVGQLQNEQGYFVGSQLYGLKPSEINIEAIENGQFRLMEKPGDGVRLVYMPKDLNDFTYYQLTTGKSGNGGSRVPQDTVTVGMASNEFKDAMFLEGTVNAAFKTKQTIVYANDADCIAIYWKGLKSDVADDLRIDVTRKFNGFPLPQYRDILDLTKPKKVFDPKRTVDIISDLQNAIPQLAGHSIKAMDRVADEIQEFIPNVGHLYNEGMLKEGTSLRGFAEQLQAVNGMEGQVVVPGRIYD